MQIDALITAYVNSFSGRFALLDGFMIFFAKAAIFLLVLSVAVRWFPHSKRELQRYLAISCGFAVALGLLLNQGILLLVDRVRPYDLGVTHLIVERSADPSFPSDHATVAFAIALMLLLKRDRLANLYLLFALLVALARIYIGTHFLTDVLGGVATALIGSLLVHKLYNSESMLNQRLIRIL